MRTNTIHYGKWAYKRMTETDKDFTTLLPLGNINLIDMYRDYDVFYAHLLATERLANLEDMLTLKHIDEWCEDANGICVWWSESQIENRMPIEEPFYVGLPLDTNFPDDAQYYITFTVFGKEKSNEDKNDDNEQDLKTVGVD